MPKALFYKFFLIVCLFALGPGLTFAQTVENQSQGAKIVFPGKIKPVIYVSDVLASQKFYTQVLGFGFETFHDYKTGASVEEWTAPYPPIYAEIFVGDQKIGLHLPQNEADRARIGGAKIYVRVEDIDVAFQKISEKYPGIGELKKTAWMDFFAVTDPDGNQILLAETDPGRHSIDPW